MGNCLFLCARGWGIDRQVRTKLQIPGGGKVTGRIEPCMREFKDNNSVAAFLIGDSLVKVSDSRLFKSAAQTTGIMILLSMYVFYHHFYLTTFYERR